MNERLDAIDRQLLSLLQANAREPAAILARKLGLARTTVVARIARLEREHVVAGYGVRLGLLEEAAVRAYCFISVLPKTPAAVIRELERMPEVEEVSSVSGPYDYLIFLRCETHEQLDAAGPHRPDRRRQADADVHRAEPQGRPPQRRGRALRPSARHWPRRTPRAARAVL